MLLLTWYTISTWMSPLSEPCGPPFFFYPLGFWKLSLEIITSWEIVGNKYKIFKKNKSLAAVVTGDVTSIVPPQVLRPLWGPTPWASLGPGLPRHLLSHWSCRRHASCRCTCLQQYGKTLFKIPGKITLCFKYECYIYKLSNGKYLQNHIWFQSISKAWLDLVKAGVDYVTR